MSAMLLMIATMFACVMSSFAAGKVVYAVNAGGDSHVDSFGIAYLADPLNIGVRSDYGRRQTIIRAAPQDNILYQTERWNDQSFSYDVPVKEDGDYVLVLKFAEVYFYAPNLKVFNVQLNNRHVIMQDFDIFSRVGHSTAYDEVIPLSIRKGKLSVKNEYSTFNGVLTIEFVKGLADNPKICAFYLMKGTTDDVPKLPEMKKYVDDDEDVDENEEEYEETSEKISKKSLKSANRDKIVSGPPAADPYAEDSSSFIMPIMVAFAIFVPTLACICRL